MTAPTPGVPRSTASRSLAPVTMATGKPAPSSSAQISLRCSEAMPTMTVGRRRVSSLGVVCVGVGRRSVVVGVVVAGRDLERAIGLAGDASLEVRQTRDRGAEVGVAVVGHRVDELATRAGGHANAG